MANQIYQHVTSYTQTDRYPAYAVRRNDGLYLNNDRSFSLISPNGNGKTDIRAWSDSFQEHEIPDDCEVVSLSKVIILTATPMNNTKIADFMKNYQ